jgi:hypothetical protein
MDKYSFYPQHIIAASGGFVNGGEGARWRESEKTVLVRMVFSPPRYLAIAFDSTPLVVLQ